MTEAPDKDDSLAVRQNLISTQRADYNQIHIETIKSLFLVSVISLGFNLDFLKPEDLGKDFSTFCWIVSNIFLIIIVFICFYLFSITKSCRMNEIKLLLYEDRMSTDERIEKEKEVSQDIEKWDDLLSRAYIMFALAIVCVFLGHL